MSTTAASVIRLAISYLPWILKRDRTRWSNASVDWTMIPAPGQSGGPLIQGQFATIEDAVVNAVAADLDGDGQRGNPDAELRRQTAWWLDKTEKHSWPYTIPGSGFRFDAEPAVVADLDGDGHAGDLHHLAAKGGNAVGKLIILSYQGVLPTSVDLPAPRGGNWNGGLPKPTSCNWTPIPTGKL